MFFEKAMQIGKQVGDDQTRFMAMNGKSEILSRRNKHREALLLFDSA